MLEGLVAWVLNNYLGKYVENLNTDQLSVALLSGKVELENLPLKKDALRHLGLPVEVRAGFIGKVQLQVPVRQIRSAPWLIAIEKLYLVAAPVNLDEWDSTVEANIAHDRKMALLDALEAQWRASHEASDGYYATSYSSWLSYGTGLLANIVENLQLKLNDVHIRYEDTITCHPSAFACGLTVESLAAESCDSDWRRGFTLLADADGCSFKLLELQQLAVYWDPMPVPQGIFANCTLQELTVRMSQTWKCQHQYLVSPASAAARVRRERSEQPLRSRTRPRISAHLTLDSVLLNLTSRQYNEAVGCSLGLERIGRLRELRLRRPAAPVLGHARLWWLYALDTHVRSHHWTEPKPTWESCLDQARKTRQYVEICLGILSNPAAALPPERKLFKDEFEWRTPLHILKPLREIAMRKVPKASPVSTPDTASSSGRSMLVHWFPQWWGWYGSSPPPDTAAAPVPDLEEEILDVIADSIENNTLLKRDTVFGKFEFILNKGSLNLVESAEDGDDNAATGVELQFSRVRVRVESRPRAGAHALHVSLGAVCLLSRITPGSLFPVLIAPQGMIREGLSAMNTRATTTSWCRAQVTQQREVNQEPLFQLSYEKKPFGLNCDYKLWVKSASLEVVYCWAAARWARALLWAPWGARASQQYASVRDHTRARLVEHWEHMMQGDRRSWQVELDISAPQILFVEDLCNRDASVLVVDFGRLRLANAVPNDDAPATPTDDEEMFMTPCSTPPGSLLSPSSPPEPAPLAAPPPDLDAATLHMRLYDRYNIELSDLQILVGRARDNWKYAHTRSSSSLHLLDRFSISLQAERRVVATADPQFPTATLRGSLPALVVHLSEHKLAAARAVLLHSPLLRNLSSSPTGAGAEEEEEDSSARAEEASSEHAASHSAKLFVLQFSIDQLSLEVQSRGRSIAEVQVCGVRAAAALSARPSELSLSLSVHSLLLVDALQTYGTDFELLVASHKHVGMDTASGSIRGSEPTSPTSPTSPECPAPRGAPALAHPQALHHALHSLRYSAGAGLRAEGGRSRWEQCPGQAGWAPPGLVDSEALIAVELCIVKGEGDSEDLRIANILFNNLDIIANQETIVELIGFAQRVWRPADAAPRMRRAAAPPPDDFKKEVRTEITFDFHRLGVLLLRAAVHEGNVVARKIATATVSEARIQATLDSCHISVDGSLGGVQVVSLCEGAGVHTRVLAAGTDRHQPDSRALLFTVTRKLETSDDAPVVQASVSVHVASVWYTHSRPLLRELRSCLTEFKQYLANLARSIRAAAHDMARGLVHPRSESLYSNSKLSMSTDGVSPRRRTASMGCSVDDPPDLSADNIVLSVSIELESPVVVLPRAAHSSEVFVAHLGRMSLGNKPGPPHRCLYRIRVRDISLASLDVAEQLKTHQLSGENMSQIYDVSRGKPVLHNTALQLSISYADTELDGAVINQCEIRGKIVGSLQISARREQYEQMLETIRWISVAPDERQPDRDHTDESAALSEPAVPTLRLDPALRAQQLLLAPPPPAADTTQRNSNTDTTVRLEVSSLKVELRAERGGRERSLVQLAFRDFSLLHRARPHSLQVSLHSITMEDLSKEPESKHRMMMVSHTAQKPAKAVFVSASCPELRVRSAACARAASLPDKLHVLDREWAGRRSKRDRDSKCGVTPPCSPAEPQAAAPDSEDDADGDMLRADDNLVWVSVQWRPDALEEGGDNIVKVTKVEFNCLKLVVSIDSWVTVLDFFGIAGDDAPDDRQQPHRAPTDESGSPGAAGAAAAADAGTRRTEMSIRSLSVVLVRGAAGEACRALVSRVRLTVNDDLTAHARHIQGRLGALQLTDLSPHALLWRDRFRTHAHHALTFHYTRLCSAEAAAAAAGYDTSLSIEIGPATYVHTKRFVLELQAFAREFSLLRRVILQARKKVSVSSLHGRLRRTRLQLSATTPVIVLPVSARAQHALAAELARLTLRSEPQPDRDPAMRPLLDVRCARLEGVSLWCARYARGAVRRHGPPLLHAPAHLTLRCESNMSDTHDVADLTIQGTLTTLQVALDPAQYRLLRGVLAHNLGEDVDDVLPAAPPLPDHNNTQVWTTTSLKLELQDVRVQLQSEHGASSLACINFIKSRLLVETYCDLSQDIDLVSQEILVSDTRFTSEPANRRGNVFSHIVQPMAEHRHSVQLEVHARKRLDTSAYTILVNNMRLMAILDWWEAANQFIMQPPPPPADLDQMHLEEALATPRGGHAAPRAELKLNVTDSQLVLVEDASVWDTNAVILRSTCVLTYRPADAGKPVSCSLTELELFSCVLGLEEETALSIVEPAAVHVTLGPHTQLHVAMGNLNLRLSYHDMRMFTSMLQSLPAQARAALAGKLLSDERTEDAPANSVHMQRRAAAGGRRWPPAPPPAVSEPAPSAIWPLKAVQVTADCITLCVIDDCLDSDVPLLEVSLSELKVEQDLRKVEEGLEDPLLVCTPVGPHPPGPAPPPPGAGLGRLSAVLSADYYNRPLSGWEPFVEPWRFETMWEWRVTSTLAPRVEISVSSSETLNTNVTSSLIELSTHVRENWSADYYAQRSSSVEASPKGSPAGHRRRSPFVPYALRNLTGQRLWFTTLTSSQLSEPGSPAITEAGPDDSWVSVRAGDTEPFSFGARRGRARARVPASPAPPAPCAALHQLALRLDGWAPPDPVCVDRVGVFFRNLSHLKTGATARIVLEVSLEGSARKLVSVRSALQLVNRLPHAVDVRVALLENKGEWSSVSSTWRSAQVAAGATWPAPLSATPGALWTRPALSLMSRDLRPEPPAPAAIDWRSANTGQQLLHYECRMQCGPVYRFCCSIVRERFPPEKGSPVAGHTLTLLPALQLENLLPLELQYRCCQPDNITQAQQLGPGDTRPFHEVNVEEGVELSVKLEGFGWSSPLVVSASSGAGSFSARLKLRDTRGRRLYLNARVTHKKTDGIKVSVSAAYWLVNRTGLPLVFRAEGAASDAAGQFEEHEVARMVAPLMFSFASADGGPTIAARLGRARAPTPQWCSPFGLGPGTFVKRLVGRCEAGGGAEEREFALGVSVRAGRGRYRHTNIVTFTPRYQLHNNTSHHLQFAQKCTATTLSDPGAMATHVCAVAGCYLPWHWARADRERLLCVRILAAPAPGSSGSVPPPLTGWSAGFRLDAARSLHLACRESGGGYQLVRVEVVCQAASMFVVLTDADSAPPPLRIDNYCPVSIMFHQVGCTEESVVGAHASARWALPEPDGACAISLRAPGGPRTTLQLDVLGATHHLLYQNFIYVVFSSAPPPPPPPPGSAPDENVLVLEVPLGSTRVVLGRKRYGDRSQLWRRGPNDQLIHEGSSPPQPTDALLSDDQALSPHAMVLDIEEPAPRPLQASALVLRRADARRGCTQRWRLTADGRMACVHANLCLQPAAGLMGLTPGSRVVLGLCGGGVAPREQCVSWHTLRPGSGRLHVTLSADGPTRLITIQDHKAPESGWIEGGEEPQQPAGGGGGREWAWRVSLGALGVSLVARAPAGELVHAVFAGVLLECALSDQLALSLAVKHMQWDNQLLGTPSPVLLYCLPERAGGSAPALHAALEVQRAPVRRYNAFYFRRLVLALRPLAVRLEERLILKLWAWAWDPEEESAREQPDEADYETRRMLDDLTALHATRYYFQLIQIVPSQIRLSMCTANKLEGSLSALKRRLGLTLIKFEDAAVELEPFVRAHVFDTAGYLARQLLIHFKDELKWQAAKILGSVDFLGNPLGFVADVSEGVSGLLLEGNVGALLQNVTHGISNSAAKVTESLGDGLERVVSDEAHEETRRRIRSAARGAHLAAGLRGLGLGILGGMTSLVKHSYEGATQEGLPGFLAGVGKGLVGTVTKPVIGVLDLATETASALRDTSRRSDKWVPSRSRGPRCALGAGGLLQRYDAGAAEGAALLYALNNSDYSERFLAYRTIRDTPHDIRALISADHLRIITCKHAHTSHPQIVMETHLSNLVWCRAVSAEDAHFVELGVRGGAGEGVRRPRVQADTAALACWLAATAACARQLYHEAAHTLHDHLPDCL
ncbi:intermembrane lipid transfer protein Vps13D isoform X2 [Plodia interpunctella]|uniref:intermembrane lipid transfer protein Vps13D isoform X2 n=1 Tax=Plodia interpunctella TaxID=58824 RepID=UPI0023685B80|nr:intermembrane lipid transfer protein Vps13D isoform X2 [Plodia interpunctella]